MTISINKSSRDLLWLISFSLYNLFLAFWLYQRFNQLVKVVFGLGSEETYRNIEVSRKGTIDFGPALSELFWLYLKINLKCHLS